MWTLHVRWEQSSICLCALPCLLANSHVLHKGTCWTVPGPLYMRGLGSLCVCMLKTASFTSNQHLGKLLRTTLVGRNTFSHVLQELQYLYCDGPVLLIARFC